ncbi:MAG: hypothetical protein ACI4AM_06505 [Muribaculaceae bacterium]
MAKRRLIIWCVAMVIALCTVTSLAPGCTDASASQSTREDDSRPCTSFLESNIGLDMDSTGAYVDSVLDTIPELIHKEYVRYWSYYPDSIRYKISMGIYLDEQFPNEMVRETILTMVDTILPHTFEEDIESAQADALNRRVINKQSSTDFLNSWERVFDELTRINGYGPQDEYFSEIADSRGCTVCHKIYEDAEWATYGVEFSYMYHMMNIPRCYADYYAVNKQTGKVLTLEDIISQYGRDKIGSILVAAYASEVEITGFYKGGFTGEDLISKADGVAIISEGILFYYHPYNIGCGAEGQYNLIIKP